MASNKLTNIAPTLSLGVGPATLTTSNLSTLTSPTQPLVASPLTPTQSLGTSPLSTHTFNLSANTLNTLNPLNNSQALTTLNTSHQTMAALNAPAQTLNSLSAQTGNSSSQPFLATPQVTSIVSLPQNFCFPSQPSQTPASAANQPTALNVNLGFPMATAAALTSNTISLNTNSIPLNTNTIPLNTNTIPLNTNPLPLNAGNPIPQHLIQSLSVGQQPAICASLPQNLSFPLGQAVIGMPNTAGASGGPFLSTNLGQFSGIPSVIMGNQQSVLPGTLMANTSAGQGAQLQTLGTLTPQSLSFSLTTGPVITELPVNNQPSQQVPSPANKVQESNIQSNQPVSQQPVNQVNDQQESQSLPNPGNPQESPATPVSREQSQTPSQQNQQESQNSSEPQPQSETEETVQESEQTPPKLVIQGELSTSVEETSINDPPQQPPELSNGSEALTQPSQQSADGENSPPASESQQQDTVTLDTSTSAPLTHSDEQMQYEEVGTESEHSSCDSGAVEGEKEDENVSLVGNGEITAKPKTSETQVEQVIEESNETNACLEDIKQEVEEMEETSSQCLTSHTAADCPSSSVSSPVKTEDPADHVDGLDPSPSQEQSVESAPSNPTLPYVQLGSSSGSTCGLLPCVKQEAMEVEEDEEMVMPDSTPGSEDSLDSYYQRHSPSPMASLQLTRADTTTVSTTTAAAYAKPRLEDGEEALDIKQFVGSETIPAEVEEFEFVWENYLEETGTSAVPPTAFKHVECSLQSGFTKGMRVEVANKSHPGTYWVAAVLMTCGPLLRLRYEGYEEDGSKDFWCDLTSCEIHPIGWCAENGVTLLPPEDLRDKHTDWDAALQALLKTVPAAPSYLLDKTTGTSPIEQLKEGMRLELQDADRPTQVWLVRIMENVGGRLYLRIEGMDNGEAEFWAFYLHELLHPIGWARERGYSYVPPKVLTEQGLSESSLQQVLETALKEAEEQNLPSDIFKDQIQIRQHNFKCGMKLEAVNPISDNHIGPATVVEVIDDFYFMVEMDSLEVKEGEKRTCFCCHSATPTIFPIQWTAYKGIKLTAPPGWPKSDFNWTEYLNHCSAMEAPESCFHLNCEDHGFERGMKLEAVNPENPNEICAATITKIAAHLMWIHQDSSVHIVASHVEHVGSHNLFPVGWCESNGFELQAPRRTGLSGSLHRRVAVVQPEMADGNQAREDESEGRTYCPKIYFNHKCFSGPHLSKGRIAELPCSVGPGPLNLVMKEVLSMLINVAYKSSRVLREIQLDGPPNRAMNQQILKAKYKNKSYRAVVEICRTTNQLEQFCRSVCIKLECCPFLISPHYVGDNCPEHCSSLTKTKYTYYYGKKKRKIGRPPGGHTNLENGPKKPTKRRKRQRQGMVDQNSLPSNGDEMKDEEDGDDKTSETSDTPAVDSSSSTAMPRMISDHKLHSTSATAAASKRLKRKYTHHIPPPSEIRTRGAKLPRYSFERRTHKKILLSPAPAGVSGLRSKSVQGLQMHKSPKFKRATSPEPSHIQSHSFGSSHAARALSLSSPLSFNRSSNILSISNSNLPFALPRQGSPLPFDKNPLHWSVSETVDFIKTTDCAHVAKVFREQEIDGYALLLLTLPTVQEHLDLKLGPAIKLCHEVERVKRAFYMEYDPTGSSINS